MANCSKKMMNRRWYFVECLDVVHLNANAGDEVNVVSRALAQMSAVIDDAVADELA